MISLCNSIPSQNTQWQVITLLSWHHSTWGLAIWYSRQSRQTASNCLSICLAADNQERIARSLLPSDRSAVPSRDGPSTATSPLPHSHAIQALSYFHAEGFQRTKHHQHKQCCKGVWKTTCAMWSGASEFKCGSRDRLQWSMLLVVAFLVDKRLLDTQIKPQLPSATSFSIPFSKSWQLSALYRREYWTRV